MIAAGTGNTVQIKNDMAQFTADTVGALPDLSVDDNPAADAGTDGNEYTGRSTGADTGNALRQRGHIGIIVNENRFIQIALENFTERNMIPSHIGTFDDFAGFRRSNAGNPDTDRFNIIGGKQSTILFT